MTWLDELLSDMPDFEEALCAQVDGELFFPEKGGSTRDAKQICRSCADKTVCLEYALSSRQRFGIWGGHSERERRRLAQARGIDWSENRDKVDHGRTALPTRTVDDDTRRRLSEAAYARHAARRAAAAAAEGNAA